MTRIGTLELLVLRDFVSVVVRNSANHVEKFGQPPDKLCFGDKSSNFLTEPHDVSAISRKRILNKHR